VEIIMISDKIDDKIYCMCKLLWSVIRLMIDLLYVEIIMISDKIGDRWLVIRSMIIFIECGNYYDKW
jgi:hypothetical protein